MIETAKQIGNEPLIEYLSKLGQYPQIFPISSVDDFNEALTTINLNNKNGFSYKKEIDEVEHDLLSASIVFN